MKFPKYSAMPTRESNQLWPVVAFLMALLIYLVKKELGLVVGPSQTYRTSEYQQGRYDIGRKAPWLKKKIVTNAKPGQSPHEGRYAFDLVILKGAKPYDSISFAKIGKIAKRIGLRWGGDWDGDGIRDKLDWDDCHFEYSAGYSHVAIMRAVQVGASIPRLIDIIPFVKKYGEIPNASKI